MSLGNFPEEKQKFAEPQIKKSLFHFCYLQHYGLCKFATSKGKNMWQ